MSDQRALDPDRRAGLHAAKLRALVSKNFEVPDGDVAGLVSGATLASGERGWYLAEVDPEKSLGWALAWARQKGLASLDLVTGDAAGHLARRAAAFGTDVRVWRIDGDTRTPAVPVDHPVPPAAPEGIEVLVDLLRGADHPVLQRAHAALRLGGGYA